MLEKQCRSIKGFGWHGTSFNQPNKYEFCCSLSDYLHKDIFRNATNSVQTLKKLERNGRTARNALNASITSGREQMLLKLTTVYLCGLYDQLGDESQKDDTHVLVGSEFPSLPRN